MNIGKTTVEERREIIGELPRIMIFSVKRFVRDANFNLKKDDTQVNYPIEGLKVKSSLGT